MVLNRRLTSATPKRMLFVRKFSIVPSLTGREMQPRGITNTEQTPENRRDDWSFPIRICSFLKVARLMRLSVAPPSIKTWYNLTLAMVGETSSGSCLAPAMILGRSEASNPIKVSTHLWCGCFRCWGRRRCNFSAQGLDDAPGRDVPRTSEHDVERFAALFVIGLKVRVAIDSLQCPPGILELHLYVFLLLWVDFLLPSCWREGMPSWRGCCIFSQNCLMCFLISQHSNVL
jgi:hypothetical protein